MHRSGRTKVLLYFHWILICSFSAEAAEIRLKSRCACGDPLVRLHHVAQVVATDPEHVSSVSSLALFPTPSSPRVISRQQIQNLLVLQGVDLNSHRFSGSTTVRVLPLSTVTTQKPVAERPASATAMRRVEQAILTYLENQDADTVARQVKARFDGRYAALVADDQVNLHVSGGQPPWRDSQSFTLSVNTAGGTRKIPVTADIAVQQMAVFARHKLERGQLLRAPDLVLRPVDPNSVSGDVWMHIDDVVGQQVQRQINPHEPIRQSYVRLPLLVRRGDVVTVYAIASGVRVRTNATALNEGSQGALITVQPAEKNRKFTARVTGLRQAEVFADGSRVP